MHATKAMLVDYADGELGTNRDWVTRHVHECSSCQAALGDLQSTRSSFAALLSELDDAEPAWPQELPFVYGARTVAAPAARRRVVTTAWRWAAGIVLLSGAATALAVVRSIGVNSVAAPVRTRTVSEAPAAQAASGVLVDAVDGVVEIDLRDAAPGTRIRLSFGSNEQVGVKTQGDVNPSFVARRGRVVVQLHGAAAELGLTLPRELPLLRIQAQGKEVALVEGGAVRIISETEGIIIEGGRQ